MEGAESVLVVGGGGGGGGVGVGEGGRNEEVFALNHKEMETMSSNMSYMLCTCN